MANPLGQVAHIGVLQTTNNVIDRGYIYDSVDENALGTFVNQQNSTNNVFHNKLNTDVIPQLNLAHTRANNLERRATTLEADRATLQGRATAVETRATTLEADRAALQRRATALETRATTLEGDRAALHEEYKITRSDYVFMRNQNDDIRKEHVGLSKVVGTHTAEITSININLNNHRIAIDETKEELNKQTTIIASHDRLLIQDQKILGKHKANIANVVKNMDVNEGKVDRHEQKLSKVRSQITDVEGKIAVINTKLETKLDPLYSFHNRIYENLKKIELDVQDTVREASKENKVSIERMESIHSQVLEAKKSISETEERMNSFNVMIEQVDSLKREINELRSNHMTQSLLIQELHLLKSQQEENQKFINIFREFITANAKSTDPAANAQFIEALAKISDLGCSALNQSAISK